MAYSSTNTLCLFAVSPIQFNIYEEEKTGVSTAQTYSVSILGRDKGNMIKYTPLPEGVPKGKARGNS